MLRTKSILAPKDAADRWRISVMSRHTLQDGITPHPLITEDSYNEVLPRLAPPLKLLGDYYNRGLPWEQFEEQYLAHVRTSDVADQVRALARRSLQQDITILCIEETPERCHRRLLAEECKRYEPGLEIYLK